MLEVVIFTGIGLMAFGIDQIFTVKYGEKWYPGLSVAFWKVSDEMSKKLIKIGFLIVLVAFTLVVLLN